MADTGLAIERARDKTEEMQARAEAVDELVASGPSRTTRAAAPRSTASWRRSRPRSQVDDELASLKGELEAGGTKKELDEKQ